MSDTDEQIKKLPKWAQDHIARLNKTCAYWREIALSNSVEGSNVTYDMGPEDKFGLPNDCCVSFKLESERWKEWDRTIQVFHARGLLNSRDRSRIEVRGGRSLIVQPVSSNVISVGIEP